MVKKIGILAIQGNFNQHKNILETLGVETILVRYLNDFDKCDAIIIPGGESTAISKGIDRNNLRQVFKDYSKTNRIFGTCAGMILLSSTNKSENLNPLGIMNFTVNRNAFGRQIESFSENIQLNFKNR